MCTNIYILKPNHPIPSDLQCSKVGLHGSTAWDDVTPDLATP